MKTLITIFFGIAILFSFNSYSQGLPPLGSLPMYYNGGFAGEASAPRAVVSGTVQNYSNPRVEKGAFFCSSFDTFIPKIRTGVGLSGGYRYNSELVRKTSFVSIAISPKISWKGKYTFAPFADFTYLVDKKGFERNPLEEELFGEFYSSSGKVGLLFNSQKLYLGYSVEYYGRFRNEEYAFLGNGRRPFSSALQIGYSFQGKEKSSLAFTPQLVIGVSQLKTQTIQVRVLDVSLMFKKRKFIWGLNNNGVALGYQNSHLKIMVSQMILRKFYNGNITIRYIFKNTSKDFS